MRTWNRTAVVVTPKQPFLDWLRSVDSESQELSTEDVVSHPSVYLLAESRDDVEAAKRLARVCKAIFEEELNSWYEAPELWPRERGFRVFKEWFDCKFHSMVFDLCADPPVAEDL